MPKAGSAVVGVFGGYGSGRQSTNAISFSIRTLSFFGLRPTASTAARYRAGLYDADKNELGEADVVIGGEKSNQANNAAGR